MFSKKTNSTKESGPKKAMKLPNWLNLNRIETPARIGVDLGTSAIKMVELKEGRGIEVENMAALSIPPGLITEQGIQDIEAVANAIRQCWGKLNTSVKHVSLALPPSQVITGVFRVPNSLSKGEQRDLAFKEVSSKIPFSMDEASWDFMPLTPPGEGEFFDALMVAAVKDKVAERVGVVEAAGLTVDTVDVENLALQHLLLKNVGQFGYAENELVAIIDLGHANVNYTVLRNNRPIWTREMPYSRADIDKQWQTAMGLDAADFREARKGKKPEWLSMGVPFVEKLADDVFHGFNSFPNLEDVSLYLICGGGSLLPNLNLAFSGLSGKAVQTLTPFAGFHIPVKVANKGLHELESVFAVAAGLALRKFDPTINIEDLV
jgi:type IV pilus assembly protein PilM